MTARHSPLSLWRAIRNLPDFGRLVWVRILTQFSDGLFQAGLAGALLFNPQREVEPWAIAGAFAVLLLPYSAIGPFAGALLDRWDRRTVLIGANLIRVLLVTMVGLELAFGAAEVVLLLGALVVNGVTRFVTSGLSAALPHVVPREQVATMNSVATAVGGAATFAGLNFMLMLRAVFGAGDLGSATVIFLVIVPALAAARVAAGFHGDRLGPDDTARAVHGSAFYAIATGWIHGARTIITTPSVFDALIGLAAHRMVFGVNTLLMLVLVRNTASVVAGIGAAFLFMVCTTVGSFLGTVFTPALLRRFGRGRTLGMALGGAVVLQLSASGLYMPVLLGAAFGLGMAGQVIKLCADIGMQTNIDDALRGHVFAVQDSLFWVMFIGGMSVGAAFITHAHWLALSGAVIYLIGLIVHMTRTLWPSPAQPDPEGPARDLDR
ncbi:MFS transporter [Mycobacterium sp. CBMA271]|uniref:MFS transporter n=1 Tax=unclassified Mycobacteroides TaxID=2618759 RepID=UPI0012DF9157|nr:MULTISPECIES: MFS transporter [unclassified Mycobacteroides]MUM17086.1 MFS transporter [Mycobacteroides sp. CBMA 326]MUM23324.1 MFS transporter [Mycobacteroides sp. CBMA 271]